MTRFTLGDLCLHTDGTLRKVIAYNASGLVVTVGAFDGRRPEVQVCEECELVKVEMEVAP